MTGGAVLRAATAGAVRRLTQTVVIFVVLAASATAVLTGLTLAANPTRAFQAVSGRYRTADLAVTVDATKVTPAQLARTRQLPGVTRAAGYPATTVSVRIPATPGYRNGAPVTGPLTLVGRAARAGPLDVITQKSGRWPARLGEIDQNDLSGTRGSVGQLTTITVTSLPSRPKLALVGFGSLPAQDDTQNAWALPATIAALERAGAPRQEQLLFTFKDAATVGQVRADLAELRAALPAGAIAGYALALASAGQSVTGQGIKAASAEPYSVMAMLLATVITASAAVAAVRAGYRRIGVLKSIGFTPAQVVAAYLVQLGLPALAGAVAGTAAGNVWVLPQLQQRPLFGVTVAVPAWIDLAVPAGMLVLTGLAALGPAVRAGRRAAVQAITVGQVPRAGPGTAAARLPLPRPVTAGLAAPFTWPSRSAATLATLTVGLFAAVLAVGLSTQITKLVLSIGVAYIDRALFQRLAWLVVVLAAVGVFSTLLMQARERVRDLGVYKALGMTPGQVVTMVTGWAVVPAVLAVAIALPAGVLLEPVVARAVASAQAGPAEDISSLLPGPPGGAGGAGRAIRRPGQRRPAGQRSRPGQAPPARQRVQNGPSGGGGPGVRGLSGPLLRAAGQDPYTAGELALLALAGLALAVAGAAGPAVWAAASRTTTALHAE